MGQGTLWSIRGYGFEHMGCLLQVPAQISGWRLGQAPPQRCTSHGQVAWEGGLIVIPGDLAVLGIKLASQQEEMWELLNKGKKKKKTVCISCSIVMGNFWPTLLLVLYHIHLRCGMNVGGWTHKSVGEHTWTCGFLKYHQRLLVVRDLYLLNRFLQLK